MTWCWSITADLLFKWPIASTGNTATTLLVRLGVWTRISKVFRSAGAQRKRDRELMRYAVIPNHPWTKDSMQCYVPQKVSQLLGTTTSWDLQLGHWDIPRNTALFIYPPNPPPPFPTTGVQKYRLRFPSPPSPLTSSNHHIHVGLTCRQGDIGNYVHHLVWPTANFL